MEEALLWSVKASNFTIIPVMIFSLVVASTLILIALNYKEYTIKIILLCIAFIIVVPVTFGILSYSTNNMYKSHVAASKKEIKINIDSNENKIIDDKTDTFKVNGKDIKVIKDGNVIYKKDSSDKPYIIAEKISFNAAPVWFVSKQSTDNLNSENRYILKEVHN